MTVRSWRDELELVVRQDDGERLGFLRQIHAGVWEPLNLLGIPLGAPGLRDHAVRTITDHGLSAIDRVWWLRAPNPLVHPRIDARSVDESADWRRMVVVELTSDEALLRSAIPWPEEAGNLVSVALPAHDVLLSEEPHDE